MIIFGPLFLVKTNPLKYFHHSLNLGKCPLDANKRETLDSECLEAEWDTLEAICLKA